MSRSKAEKILREIESRSAKEFLPIIGPNKGRILTEVVRENKPKTVLEVGTLIGYSAILMGKELDKEARLTTIEIHPDEAREAEENIKKAEISPTVNVVIGDALKILPELKENFDLVFIDAEKNEYIRYLRHIEDKLHKGSIIVADNAGIFAEDMKVYLNYVRSSG
ncbi:MAG: hypothetical protein QG670_1304 [Thermoproteota archaeon]|nr:hypothetical protein [Thermoproteota archaeon]